MIIRTLENYSSQIEVNSQKRVGLALTNNGRTQVQFTSGAEESYLLRSDPSHHRCWLRHSRDKERTTNDIILIEKETGNYDHRAVATRRYLLDVRVDGEWVENTIVVTSTVEIDTRAHDCLTCGQNVAALKSKSPNEFKMPDRKKRRIASSQMELR